MKYKYLFGLAALALGFTACDDIEDSNSEPQTNPQLEQVDPANVTVTAGSSTTSTLDLDALNAAGATITMAKVTDGTDWPEGFTANVPFVEVATENTFESPLQVETTMGAEGDVIMNPDDLQEAFVQFFGRNPASKQLYVRVPVYAVNGSQSIRMGGAKYWYGNFPITVKPFDQFGGNVIEEAYYIIGSFNNYGKTGAIKMKQDVEGDPYDHPTFSVIIPDVAANTEVIIIPESTYAAMGTLPTTAKTSFGGEYEGINKTSGDLLPNEAGARANGIVIEKAGAYNFKINMETLTYNYVAAIANLYTVGDATGWAFGSPTLSSTDFVTYTGYAHLSGGFKFTNEPGWGGTNYGIGKEEGFLSTDGAAGNLTAPADGLFHCTVNIEKLTYSLVQIKTVGVIGDATPGGWDADTELTPSADFLSWSAVVEMKDGTFKFRMNGGWDYNLGGALDNLVAGGDNINVAAGKYLVTIDFSALPVKASLTAQ